MDTQKQNFLSLQFGTKFQTEVALILKIPEFHFTQRMIGGRKLPFQKSTRFIQPFRQNSDLTDRHILTDTGPYVVPPALA